MRIALTLAAGFAASWGGASWLPADERSALGAVLVVLPLVLALFEVVRQLLAAAPPSGLERLLGAGWLATALGIDRLGVRFGEELLFAALLLLVAVRVGALLPGLRRRFGRGGRGGRWPFFLLPLAVGLAVAPWSDRARAPNGDEPYFLLLAESIASDLDFDLSDEYRNRIGSERFGRPIEPQPGDFEGADGTRRSRHESLLVFYLVPFWIAGGTLGCRIGMLLLWAALSERLVAMFRALQLPAGGAFRAWAATLFAPPLALFATQIWTEVPAALAVAIAIESWASARRVEPRRARRSYAAFALALVALPLLKLRLAAIAIPIAAARLLERGRRLPASGGLLAIAALVAFVLSRNRATVGRPLGVYSWSDLPVFDAPPVEYLLHGVGLFFDLAFGLLALAPIWIYVLVGIGHLVREGGVARTAFVAAFPYLLLLVSLDAWYGGWSPPFRYGVALLPILAVALAHALPAAGRSGSALLWRVLATATLLATVAVWVEPTWGTSFADGRSRLADALAGPFAADLVRLLPSAVRPRLATLVVPLVALALVVVARRIALPRRLGVIPLAATAILVLGASALVAGHRLPLRVVEAEDPWLGEPGAALRPERWAMDRGQQRAGRRLEPGGPPLEFTPIAGGDRVVIRIVDRIDPTAADRALLVVSSSGAGELYRRELGPGGSWTTEALPEMVWREGERLRVEVRPAIADRPATALIVDRVELEWR